MKVRLKKNTYHGKYGVLTTGEVIDVDSVTGERWQKRGLAEMVEKPEPPKVVKPEKVEPEPFEEVIEDDGPELEEMTVNELRELARAENVPGLWSMSKAELVNALRGE